MKRAILLLTLAVMVVGLVHLPASALLVNGGFETGDFFGWNVSGDDETTGVVKTYSSYNSQEGDWFAVLETGAPRTLTTISQTGIDLNAGDVLSGWVVFNNGGCPDYIGASMQIWDGGITDIFTINPNSNWAQWTLTAPSDGTYSFELVLANGGTLSSGYLLFDANPSCPPVPEPASMLLLGTGLLGLVGLRRKGKK